MSIWDNRQNYAAFPVQVPFIPILRNTKKLCYTEITEQVPSESNPKGEHTMKKQITWIALLLITLLTSIALVGFTSEENFTEQANNPCRYSSASAMSEGGWLYVLDYYRYESPIPEDLIDVYNFQCINLRYLDESCKMQWLDTPYLVYAGSRTTPDMDNTGMIPLNSPDYVADHSSDMARINNEILTKDKTPEELLALNPDDFDFAFIDKELFFSLLQQALNGEAVEICHHQSHLDGIAYGPAILTEPEFVDGYRFQVSYFNTVLACESEGCVQHLYIDLQYETAEGYVLLSDLVKQGIATREQTELHHRLQAIAQLIMEQDNYTAGAEIYGELSIDGVDLGRLAPMVSSVSKTHL